MTKSSRDKLNESNLLEYSVPEHNFDVVRDIVGSVMKLHRRMCTIPLCCSGMEDSGDMGGH